MIPINRSADSAPINITVFYPIQYVWRIIMQMSSYTCTARTLSLLRIIDKDSYNGVLL